MEGKFVDIDKTMKPKKEFENSDNIGNKQLYTMQKSHKSVFFYLIKRVGDIFLSIIGLFLLVPVFTVVAFLIKKEEPKGSVFFSQTRVGKNGKLFVMYKFRSMCLGAEEQLPQLLKFNEIEGAMFKMKCDPRVTKIGKLIRRTSIDELPQLVNVLKGEMSLVGPRPPLPREVEKYTDYDSQRLSVKPGCTGLWQISGRNDLGFKEMVELDIKYINTQSIWNDTKIIFQTAGIMFGTIGAY